MILNLWVCPFRKCDLFRFTHLWCCVHSGPLSLSFTCAFYCFSTIVFDLLSAIFCIYFLFWDAASALLFFSLSWSLFTASFHHHFVWRFLISQPDTFAWLESFAAKCTMTCQRRSRQTHLNKSFNNCKNGQRERASLRLHSLAFEQKKRGAVQQHDFFGPLLRLHEDCFPTHGTTWL